LTVAPLLVAVVLVMGSHILGGDVGPGRLRQPQDEKDGQDG
jgi:hypothetical protein